LVLLEVLILVGILAHLLPLLVRNWQSLFRGIHSSKQIAGIATEAWGLMERCRNKRKKPELTVFSSILAGGRTIRKTTL